AQQLRCDLLQELARLVRPFEANERSGPVEVEHGELEPLRRTLDEREAELEQFERALRMVLLQLDVREHLVPKADGAVVLVRLQGGERAFCEAARPIVAAFVRVKARL